MNDPDLTLKHALEVKGLAFAYEKGSDIFHDVSFTLHRGEVLQLLGANGSGKSTLMNCLVGLLHPRQGSIRVLGDEEEQLSREELARRIAYVPQLQNSTCRFTVRDYVVMGRAPYLGLLHSPGPEDYARADQALWRMSIAHLADQRLQELSGGERQLAQIARALVQQSPVLLFDEPTNHLDYGNQHRMLLLLHSLAKEGYAVMASTHMPDAPLLTGGQVGLFTSQGFCCGPAEELICRQRLKDLYHIDVDVLYINELGRKACFCRFFNGNRR